MQKIQLQSAAYITNVGIRLVWVIYIHIRQIQDRGMNFLVNLWTQKPLASQTNANTKWDRHSTFGLGMLTPAFSTSASFFQNELPQKPRKINFLLHRETVKAFWTFFLSRSTCAIFDRHVLFCCLFGRDIYPANEFLLRSLCFLVNDIIKRQPPTHPLLHTPTNKETQDDSHPGSGCLSWTLGHAEVCRGLKRHCMGSSVRALLANVLQQRHTYLCTHFHWRQHPLGDIELSGTKAPPWSRTRINSLRVWPRSICFSKWWNKRNNGRNQTKLDAVSADKRSLVKSLRQDPAHKINRNW